MIKKLVVAYFDFEIGKTLYGLIETKEYMDLYLNKAVSSSSVFLEGHVFVKL